MTQMGWPEPLALPQHATSVPCPASEVQTVVHGQVLQPVAGRYRSQFPFTQTSFVAQTFWHPPQFNGSVFRSTQATRLFTWQALGVGSLHAFCPLATHVPAEQACPVVHAFAASQPPQWAGSDIVSTHWPLQSVRPSRQTHLPPLHASRSPHVWPQVPQLRGSFCRSRHCAKPPPPPPHSVRPAPQAQMPPEQLADVPLHTLPQPPQF